LSAENDYGEGVGIENDIEDINEHESMYRSENKLDKKEMRVRTRVQTKDLDTKSAGDDAVEAQEAAATNVNVNYSNYKSINNYDGPIVCLLPRRINELPQSLHRRLPGADQ
jgi:hypothetical protein